MKREKGFTLVELLSVVVILGVTFMFVLPKLVGLINDGEDKEIELIEERVLSAAKDYVNYIDGSFYTKLYKEGDTNYIYKTDLINSGLLNKEEISKLDTFAGVKGELLSNDKLRYTVEYINAEPEEYTNEELYLMIQNMGGGSSGGSVDNEAIDNLQSQINDINTKADNNLSAITEINVSLESNTTDINSLKDKNSFLDAYPVGSIYISTSDENPSTIGGTWELVDKRFKPLAAIYDATTSTVAFTPTSNLSKYDLLISREGNTIRIRLHMVAAVAFADSTLELGAINLSSLGVTSFSGSYLGFPCGTDDGNGIALVYITNDRGVVEVRDVVTKTSGGTIPVDSDLYCDFTTIIEYTKILDSAASEFHFERTA